MRSGFLLFLMADLSGFDGGLAPGFGGITVDCDRVFTIAGIG